MRVVIVERRTVRFLVVRFGDGLCFITAVHLEVSLGFYIIY